MPHLIELTDIYKIYHMGDTEVHALDGISLTIDKGEFVAIVGQSGSGKSTCMNIIGCLDVATKGQYLLNGKNISNYKDDELAEVRNKMLGFIFQQYNLIPKLTVLENVELPLLYGGYSDREQKERAMSSLKRVGLDSKAKNLPSQLSGSPIPASFREVSSSVFPLRGHLREIPPSFSQTSRQARSIQEQDARLCSFCRISTRREILLFLSLTITP